MILSLCVYLFLAVALWILAKDQLSVQSHNHIVKNIFWTRQNIISILLFALIYGIKYNVGVDNLTYIRIYENLQNGLAIREDTLELGYQFIQKQCVNNGLHYSVFIGLWGALQIGLIYYALRNDKYLLPLVALFIVLGPTWLRWANLMRQAVVECAFVVLIQFIEDKKIWKYMIGMALCVLIHKSAILLIPFYFILQKSVFPKNRVIAVSCVIICTLVGASPVWIKSMEFIEVVLSFLNYQDYADNFVEIMANQSNYREWGPARAGIWLLYILAIWFYLTLRRKVNFNKRFDIYFECFFFGTCLYELFANTSQIMIRPIIYFQSFSVIVVPICLYYLWKTKHQTAYYILCVLAFFNTIWWTVKAYIGNGIGEDAPEVYKFFFLQ